MHMIRSYLHAIPLNIMIRRDLSKYRGHPLLNISSQGPFAVLECPHTVVFRVVGCMAGALYRHARSLLHHSIPCHLAIMADSSPAAGRG